MSMGKLFHQVYPVDDIMTRLILISDQLAVALETIVIGGDKADVESITVMKNYICFSLFLEM